MKVLFFTVFLFLPSLVFADRFIIGKISAEKSCNKTAQVWLSKERTLIYQVESWVGSSFELHVAPGEYDLFVATENGCAFKQAIDLSKENLKDFKVDLKKTESL